MTTTKLQWITFPLNWTWVAVGYSYFVLGHLLPITILQVLSANFLLLKIAVSGWAFGGLAVIAFLIGYRSRGVTVLEAVIASILYTLTMSAAVGRFWSHSLNVTGELWFGLAIIVAAVSAMLGEVIQHSAEQKQ